MDWKRYFINDENKKEEVQTSEVQKEVKQEKSTKFPGAFPETNTNFNYTQTIQQPTMVSNDLASKFFDAYQSAFEKMNQDGYDFFEFFQTVMHGDVNNPQTYVMAFGMGKAMDKNSFK